MPQDSDSFSHFDELLSVDNSDPWTHTRGQAASYEPDYDLLGRLLTIPVRESAVSESGIFAKGIDAWTANELRRAGFGADEVWPRATRPRVLPRDIALLLEKLPAPLRAQVEYRVKNMPSVAPVDAKVLGRAYEKQVDVCVSRWDRGPEILISTKAQLSSFGKNLPNRFEEAYGDAGNLRGRYPLAAVGFLFVQRATILAQEPDAYERAVDMVRKLRDRGDGSGYSATALVLVDWVAGSERELLDVRVHRELPDDISPPQFFTRMIERTLSVTPIVHHVRVRELLAKREIIVPAADLDPIEDAAQRT